VKPAAVVRAEALLSVEAEVWARVVRKGYSLNEHWTVGFADGTNTFLKLARIDPSPQWLRDEAAVLAAVHGPVAPRLIAFEDGAEPLLVLEDLLPARWPPPWREGDVERVLEVLADVAGRHADVPRFAAEDWNGWRAVEADPEPFLATELRDASWLERMLPALGAATDAAPLDGDALLHCDVRSDNLCVKDGHVVLVDWNHARIGDARIDVAFWLPSLALERGPRPERFGVDEYAALVAGFFASRAGLPPPAGAPRVREFQRAQAAVALDWADAVV
jgi:hypothetical protein